MKLEEGRTFHVRVRLFDWRVEAGRIREPLVQRFDERMTIAIREADSRGERRYCASRCGHSVPLSHGFPLPLLHGNDQDNLR
jgi:hypothetical protein